MGNAREKEEGAGRGRGRRGTLRRYVLRIGAQVDRISFHHKLKGILHGGEGVFWGGRMGRMGRALAGSVDVRIARYGQKD